MTRLTLIALLAGLATPLPHAAAQWTVINLHPAGATGSYAAGVSGGQQVGWASFPDPTTLRACLWSGTAASWVDLHPAGASSSQAFAVSDGQQVGVARVISAQNRDHASLWSGTAASWQDLSPPGGEFNRSKAFGISEGRLVGEARVPVPGGGGNYSNHACLWTDVTPASWVSLNPVQSGGSPAAGGISGDQQVGHFDMGGFDHAILWNGSASSWVDLHPVGTTRSSAKGVSSGQQVGDANVGGVGHASLWSGTAASWVDLNPAGSPLGSGAGGVFGGQQVGSANIGGFGHASLWTGTAASWVDLHAFLPAEFASSGASGVWGDANFTYVVGTGFNTQTLRDEALLWKQARCYPNCDGSTGTPLLTGNDFICFITKFAAGESYANCDGSTGTPMLTGNDFICFITAFAAGCS